MDFGLKGKTAMVAAASQGLGFAAAQELGREGANLVICSRSKSNIEAAARRIHESTGAEVLPLVADVRETGQIDELIKKAQQQFNQVDILVTNAGGPPAGFFDDISDERWLAGVELTLLSTIRLIRCVLPQMKKNNWGRVVNILSISVKQPISGLLVSNTLRPGLVGLAKSLADEVATTGITVNNVCPGWTKPSVCKNCCWRVPISRASPLNGQAQKLWPAFRCSGWGSPKSWQRSSLFCAQIAQAM